MSANRKYQQKKQELLAEIDRYEHALRTQTNYMVERSTDTAERVKGSGYRYLIVGGIAVLAGGALYGFASRRKSARKAKKVAKRREKHPTVVQAAPPPEPNSSVYEAIKKELLGLAVNLFRQRAEEYLSRYTRNGKDT